MKFQKLGERVVGGKPLDPIVGDPVLGPAFRTLHLPLHVVHQTFHTGVQAVRVLAGQQLGVSVPVQADAAGEQLVKLLHPAATWPLPAGSLFFKILSDIRA